MQMTRRALLQLKLLRGEAPWPYDRLTLVRGRWRERTHGTIAPEAPLRVQWGTTGTDYADAEAILADGWEPVDRRAHVDALQAQVQWIGGNELTLVRALADGTEERGEVNRDRPLEVVRRDFEQGKKYVDEYYNAEAILDDGWLVEQVLDDL